MCQSRTVVTNLKYTYQQDSHVSALIPLGDRLDETGLGITKVITILSVLPFLVVSRQALGYRYYCAS